MKTPTNKLFVNLSASQTRKRLKGFGHGVRRVEAADRNQSVISHTATGQHREELESLFSDVATGATASESGEPVENLRNIGPKSSLWLQQVGIQTRDDLQAAGARGAFLMVQRNQPEAGRNLLWALVGALRNRDWRDITAAEKAEFNRLIDDH